ncbi:hypothetical protein T265_11927 [Opisthorchis viverrini]|uniref:Peptidase C13 family protein n=1 Tax=Opisthorchis viverrini TaxID=6198 RepID=A0A074ZVP6_OPIVI|nr:hypothetical protein T265_11927 [Opisthorchis viverrini]KER19234.1 hypothetical protein T265_11927 [Opisthorchis viverrini]
MKLQVSRYMMRRCSLIFAFFSYIKHVATLEATGVQNWSSLSNNQPSKNWVVLAAGSNTWENYRHQANVYHAYHVVRENGVPPENIITFAYDDIANNPKNPFKGKVFHDYEHEDVYKGVVIDYRGKDVTRDNFLKVLKGDKKLEANKKKVLKSGPNDNVFIFYSGHGETSCIAFLEENLYAMELNDTLAYMHSKKMFNKYSGSMFRDVLPSNMGIYVTTSAKEDEPSFALFCSDKDIDVCLADNYSYVWVLDSEFEDIKKRTLDEQYEEVKKHTMFSHVMKNGEMLSHIVKETFRDIVIDVTTHHKPTLEGLSKRDELMCFQAALEQFRTRCFTIQQAS